MALKKSFVRIKVRKARYKLIIAREKLAVCEFLFEKQKSVLLHKIERHTLVIERKKLKLSQLQFCAV